MASPLIELNIVSPNQPVFKGMVQSLVVKGSEGELGIQYGHAPLLAAIKPSMLRYINESGNDEAVYVAGGIVEIQPNQVNVMADVAARGEQIDREKAQKAKESAKTRLAECDVKKFLAIELELMKATAQLQVADHYKKKG